MDIRACVIIACVCVSLGTCRLQPSRVELVNNHDQQSNAADVTIQVNYLAAAAGTETYQWDINQRHVVLVAKEPVWAPEILWRSGRSLMYVIYVRTSMFFFFCSPDLGFFVSPHQQEKGRLIRQSQLQEMAEQHWVLYRWHFQWYATVIICYAVDLAMDTFISCK